MGIAKSAIPEHPERYVPLLATLFAFILVRTCSVWSRLRPAHLDLQHHVRARRVSFGAYHATA